MSRINRLEIENFKSYKGNQVIGPFKTFSAIVGPNGAGKSNLMDAICFVLGVSAKDLRGDQLLDFVYRFEGGQIPPRTRCFVRVTIDNNDGSSTVHERGIDIKKKQSVFSIDGSRVDWDSYLSALHRINIFPRQKNFLVLQGSMSLLSQKDGRDITDIIEVISGSEELREEYERLQQEEIRTRELFMLQTQKRRGIAAEKKQFKEQKDEAERYNKLQNEYKELRVNSALLQLLHIDQQLQKHITDRTKRQKTISDIEARQSDATKKLEVQRKTLAKSQKTELTLNQRARDAETALEKRTAPLFKLRSELANVDSSLQEHKTELQQYNRRIEEQTAKLELLRSDFRDLEAAEQTFEAEQAELSRQEERELTESQLAEFTRLREQVSRETSASAQALAFLQRQQDVDTASLTLAQGELSELEEQRSSLKFQVSTKNQEIESLVKQKESVSAKKAELEAEKDRIVASNEKAKSERQLLSDQLQGIQKQLLEAKTDLEYESREKKQVDAIESMKRLFPGVYGRVIDLCQPKNARYNVAMTVAMGNHLDSIVVQDTSTALGCVQYLKDQHVGTATFLPLDTIKSSPIEEKLRSLGKRIFPVLDLLTYDKQIQRAVEYVCGSTLVVESLAEARRIAFGAERYRVVTTDGVLILKSGLMTGGTTESRGLDARARRWEEKAVAKLKKNRDDALSRLAELGQQLRLYAHEQKLATQISALEEDENKVSFELQLRRDKIEAEEKVTASKIESTKKRIKALETEIAKRRSEIEKLERTIKEVEVRVFAPLSASLGVENVLELEKARVERGKLAATTRLRFETQRARIQQLIDYEASRDLRKEKEEKAALVKKEEETVKSLKDQIAKQESVSKKESSARDKVLKEVQAATSEATSLSNAVKDLKKELESVRKAFDAQVKLLQNNENLAMQLRHKRLAIYQTCVRDEIQLPVISGELPTGIETAAVESELSQALVSQDDVQIDFKKMPRNLQSLSAKDADEKMSAFEAQLSDLRTKLDNIAPNLKADSRLQDVENRMSKTLEEVEELKAASTSAMTAFKEVKDRRARLFRECFDHISQQIDVIYKQLTGGAGTAYLNLEDLEEPYLHGVSYNPMPPFKPFGAIENLSGGEKAVAALALLFAVASFKPAPFFVLDEVDAALDSVNVLRVAEYFREQSLRGTQFIVISLKDRLFEKSDGLIGVYIDPQLDSSSSLTLDLEIFND